MAKRATKAGGKKGAPGKKGAGAKKPAAKKPAAGKKAAAKKPAASKKAAVKKAAPAKKKAAVKKAAPAAKKSAPARKKAALKGVAKKAAPVLKSVAKKAAPILKKVPRKAKAVKAKAAVALKPLPAYELATSEDFEIIDEQPEEKKPGRAKRAATGVLNAALKVALAPVKAVAAAVSGGSRDNAAELVTRLEEAYGVSMPERYRRFLSEGEHERYRRIELSGYIRGPYDLDFTDRLLTDVTELGENAGIHDMGDVPWNDDYAGYVPLASMSHPDLDEPKLFLVHDVARPAHRVFLFDYDGWRLYPLADSFDAFLANLPKATNDISTAFRPGPMT
jgi:hypothetical protein